MGQLIHWERTEAWAVKKTDRALERKMKNWILSFPSETENKVEGEGFRKRRGRSDLHGSKDIGWEEDRSKAPRQLRSPGPDS